MGTHMIANDAIMSLAVIGLPMHEPGKAGAKAHLCVCTCRHAAKTGLRILQISAHPAIAIRSSIAFDLPAPTNGDPDHDFALQMWAHHQVI